MISKQHLASCMKAMLIALLCTSSSLSWAQVYKGEDSAPPRKIYKGEIEANDYASNYVPKEAKYPGDVYSSDLYRGPLEDNNYFPVDARSLHDGFYLGLEGGYDSYSMQNNINTYVAGKPVFQQNPVLNAVGVSYTFVGGFGKVFDDPLYMGTELFYNYSLANTSENVHVNSSGANYYIKSQVLNTYGASFLPGLKLGNSVLLYLKGGYTRIEAKTTEYSALLSVNNAQSNGCNAVHYGLGIEADVFKNWSVRGEYTHLNGENFTTRVGTRVTVSDNQFMFGVIMHFI